jgi:D-sedoheptulose 7-phosphate isomerase
MTAALDELPAQAESLARIAEFLVTALRNGGKVLAAGNGGSAAEAQHFAAELVGRFRQDRRPFAALALTTDTSILTAVANDYAYEEVFARQVEALGRPGDVLLAFSTSGQSRNLLRAAQSAHDRQIRVVALTGMQPSPLADAADLVLRAPGDRASTVQEIHMATSHLLCGIIEDRLAEFSTDG